MKIEIKNAAKEDFKEYSKLRAESIKEYRKITGKKIKYTNKSIKSELNNIFSSKNRYILLAKEEKNVVGFIIGTKIKNIFNSFGYVDDIFVSEGFRGKSIATLLIKKFMEMLEKENIRKFRLGVSIKNKKAIKFYEKLGFKIDYYEMEKLK